MNGEIMWRLREMVESDTHIYEQPTSNMSMIRSRRWKRKIVRRSMWFVSSVADWRHKDTNIFHNAHCIRNEKQQSTSLCCSNEIIFEYRYVWRQWVLRCILLTWKSMTAEQMWGQIHDKFYEKSKKKNLFFSPFELRTSQLRLRQILIFRSTSHTLAFSFWRREPRRVWNIAVVKWAQLVSLRNFSQLQHCKLPSVLINLVLSRWGLCGVFASCALLLRSN